MRDRRGYLVTVFGPAGIGKTRLAKELAASVAGEAAVLTGRCLSYGEGISYWPIREMVNEATGERPLADLLAGEDDADAVASRVAAAIGVSESAGLAEETFWAIRRLFEALAPRKPLVLVFEDLHWAEPTLLDLVEHVPDSSRDAPILLFCLARPELLDKRPTWGGGKVNASSMLIGPLSEPEREVLLASLTGEGALSESRLGRISKASEGNPLFIEQMVAMLAQRARARAMASSPYRRRSRRYSQRGSICSIQRSAGSSSARRWRASSSTAAPSARCSAPETVSERRRPPLLPCQEGARRPRSGNDLR